MTNATRTDTAEHPDPPVDEWDGRHIDWGDLQCGFCGADLRYVGDQYDYIIRCDETGVNLLVPPVDTVERE